MQPKQQLVQTPGVPVPVDGHITDEEVSHMKIGIVKHVMRDPAHPVRKSPHENRQCMRRKRWISSARGAVDAIQYGLEVALQPPEPASKPLGSEET